MLAFFYGENMENLKIYEIKNAYIDYLVPFAPHLFHNKKSTQENERKYIGIILTVNGLTILHRFHLLKKNIER